ncbi:arginyl-tRNA synthetase [Austwickia chelonae]|uniref:Arginine--tRNA ligase n=1 Tax=Austwickia chelonae NBRC 105200 TaxID=1184607 RepID=K6VJ22_9MICO|nr:arginine--tRNA ligase [Austwickia chelonae]GAB76734.1 arginyl-tRNA synthetase [Austwickia chelonae NBRC 105200]SEW29920.1 arginyl-tRNA synthetase [Austwickia chelonae]
MTPDELAQTITSCLRDAVAAGDIPLAPEAVPAAVRVERPRNRDHGDWSTNIAMQLAKKAGQNPRELATALATRLQSQPGVSRVDIAGPGFLNIVLDAASAGELARTIVQAGRSYGRGDALAGKNVNLEFVSANPTGPIHLGGTRWAAVGDALARVLEAAGASVTREYYFNDHGAQIDRFARSLLAAAKGEEAPEDGYAGAYISDIAAAVVAQEPGVLDQDAAQAQETFRSRGVDMMFEQIKKSLHNFGVDFDVYFHENSLHENGSVDRAIGRLTELGRTEQRDGALWLKTTDFGDDKDRVIIKSDGEAAYLAGDIAYYLDKRERGADMEILILGADHHGYVGRMMAMCAAFGDTPWENLVILIGQMVNLVKDGQPVRMSKRAGTVVVMEDLVDAVGVDAARYQISRYSMDSNIDIDLDLLVQRSNDNPVFYVQYAHARTCNVARLAALDGVHRQDAFCPETLTHETESALLAILGDYPRVVAQAAALREPHRVARYLEDLAAKYHKWYDECRVRPAQRDGVLEEVTDLHRTRLWLNDATRQVLANGLDLLGVSAPEKL